MNRKKIEDTKKLTDLTNEFMEKFLNASNPQDYDDEREYFISQSLTAPAMIASEIIDKLAVMYHAQREFILKQYIDKVKLALNCLDYKNRDKE